MNQDAAIFLKFELGRDFKFGLELERLAFLELDVLDAGPADRLQLFFLHLLFEKFRKQILQDVFAHLPREFGADQADGSFAWAEARKLGLLLDSGDDAIGLAGDFIHRNGDFDFVFAAFD